jgi:hypothetical protein
MRGFVWQGMMVLPHLTHFQRVISYF